LHGGAGQHAVIVGFEGRVGAWGSADAGAEAPVDAKQVDVGD